jgi:glycosyltransferase involved in cell wall biosynthesis
MRILIATDAYRPQVNGVVRTYERLAENVETLGASLTFLTPSDFRSIPCPTYPQIQLALPNFRRAADLIRAAEPDAIHIATEGPVGWMTRNYCLRTGMPFTTSFHTRFAEYVSSRWLMPESWVYGLQRRFHNAGAGTMVATQSLASDLSQRGFRKLLPWTRGVDTNLFRPRPVRRFGDEPVFIYVGRVAIEKNIEAFLSLDLPGRKVIVGDGPQLAVLERKYPLVTFTGVVEGEELACCYASADVFVFPSRTDTFGMVILEAMASGVPVAAFPVTGPRDLVVQRVSGVLGEDLALAAREALTLDRAEVRVAAQAFSWEAAARMFLANVHDATQLNDEPVTETARGQRSPAKNSVRLPQDSARGWRLAR